VRGKLAFSKAVTVTEPAFFAGWKVQTLGHATAIFRQVNKTEPLKHHDARISGRAHCSADTEISGGVPENVVRTVTENSRTLKFDSYGFEQE
jgi:hypothetical protein